MKLYREIYEGLKRGKFLDVTRKLATGDEIREFFLPKPRLIVLGGGHIALPLARFAAMTCFNVTVFDDRPAFANKDRFPEAREVICDSFAKMSERLNIEPNDYAAIITRGHRHDQDCLRQILSGPFPRYVGMIGSRGRVGLVMRQLEEEGYSKEVIAKVHSPIGLAIGAVTPEEIALAIAAELVACKNSGSPDGETYTDEEVICYLAYGNTSNTALVTVIDVEGSTPRKAGAKMLVKEDGRLIGSIGGGCAEAEAAGLAREIIASRGVTRKVLDLSGDAEDDGMVCGGYMTVLIEALEEE
ncbi:MAG: XdhC family protein [Clostridiales bacterium]|jgi:xanthine dehydrogenase accessory factor|nr:XdhC family protein [Clostridiales bacterium]